MTFHEICPGTVIAEHCCKRSAKNQRRIAMKKLVLLLSVLMPLAVLPTTVEAKKDDKYQLAQYAAEPFMNAAPLVTGALKRFVINPEGEIDGLLFQDGTLAKFPPHMASELTAAVKPGDPVSLRGFREPAGTVKALVITNEATKRAVVEHPPAPDMRKVPKHLRFALLGRLQASGKVERLLYGKKGEMNGVMLDDGTIVRFPPHVAYQFGGQLQPGQTIAVEGVGTQNEYGRALEAMAVGTSSQTLQPIYERPAGRAAYAPPPPAPPAGPAVAQPMPPPVPPGGLAQPITTTTGVVGRFTLSPRGELDGLILGDGTEVHVPPHLSAQLAAAVRPGDTVTISGSRSPAAALVIATSVTNTASNQTVVDRGPPPPGSAPLPPAPGAQNASTQGRVQMLLHGPASDVNGALLDDGTVLRMPPHVASQFASLLVPGQSVAVQGWMLNTAFGRVIAVEAIGASPAQMTTAAPPPPPDAAPIGTTPTQPSRP
jgi:hypothetical protein